MNRTKGILAAGSLTGLVLITILALGFGSIGASFNGKSDAAAAEPTTTVIQQPQTNDQNASEAVRAWQKYSRDLENTVQTMQQREAQYQSQIDTANQTILQLQDQVNSANAAASMQVSAPASAPVSVSAPTFRGDDHHENEEHEGFEGGEFDD